jgi:hypothetical protein
LYFRRYGVQMLVLREPDFQVTEVFH